MEWLRTVKKTLFFIEENLFDEIDVNELAEKVFISPFYLQKGFQILTGYSLGEYIRNRRLYEAALKLSETDEKIIDVAFDCGYDSQESFTKAFTRFHGSSPNRIRNNKSLIRRFVPLNINIEITGGNKMNYVVSPMWGFKVIGFERIFSNETAYKEIPLFWDEICEKYCTHTIYAGLEPSCPEEQAIIDNCIGEYGVCIDDVGNGKFRYLIAGRYTGGEIPESMTLFEFPKCEWAKFKCMGPMPESLQTLNTQIFKEWLPGNPDFEIAGGYNVEWYSCDGEKTDENYESGIWIPVKRYENEAKERWGETEEYKQTEEKRSRRTKDANKNTDDGLMEIFERFGELKNLSPDSKDVQNLVGELKKYISENYYECSNVILKNLGLMYVSDERFKENIDRKGGENTAEFVNEAIKNFCK